MHKPDIDDQDEDRRSSPTDCAARDVTERAAAQLLRSGSWGGPEVAVCREAVRICAASALSEAYLPQNDPSSGDNTGLTYAWESDPEVPMRDGWAGGWTADIARTDRPRNLFNQVRSREHIE